MTTESFLSPAHFCQPHPAAPDSPDSVSQLALSPQSSRLASRTPVLSLNCHDQLRPLCRCRPRRAGLCWSLDQMVGWVLTLGEGRGGGASHRLTGSELRWYQGAGSWAEVCTMAQLPQQQTRAAECKNQLSQAVCQVCGCCRAVHPSFGHPVRLLRTKPMGPYCSSVVKCSITMPN